MSCIWDHSRPKRTLILSHQPNNFMLKAEVQMTTRAEQRCTVPVSIREWSSLVRTLLIGDQNGASCHLPIAWELISSCVFGPSFLL
jgi:hypothetical protein